VLEGVAEPALAKHLAGLVGERLDAEAAG